MVNRSNSPEFLEPTQQFLTQIASLNTFAPHQERVSLVKDIDNQIQFSSSQRSIEFYKKLFEKHHTDRVNRYLPQVLAATFNKSTINDGSIVVVELGSRMGHVCLEFKNYLDSINIKSTVIGIESNIDFVDIARNSTNAKKADIVFLNEASRNDIISSGSVNVVYMERNLSHLTETDGLGVLGQAQHMLKSGGKLVVFDIDVPSYQFVVKTRTPFVQSDLYSFTPFFAACANMIFKNGSIGSRLSTTLNENGMINIQEELIIDPSSALAKLNSPLQERIVAGLIAIDGQTLPLELYQRWLNNMENALNSGAIELHSKAFLVSAEKP